MVIWLNASAIFCHKFSVRGKPTAWHPDRLLYSIIGRSVLCFLQLALRCSGHVALAKITKFFFYISSFIALFMFSKLPLVATCNPFRIAPYMSSRSSIIFCIWPSFAVFIFSRLSLTASGNLFLLPCPPCCQVFYVIHLSSLCSRLLCCLLLEDLEISTVASQVYSTGISVNLPNH